MPSLKADVWPSVLEHIEKRVGEQRFNLWFRNIRPIKIDSTDILLGVPNLFVREWLESHFQDVLCAEVGRQLDATPTVHFVIDPHLFQETRAAQMTASAEIVEAAAAAGKENDEGNTHIRPDFTMERFVVGPGNKLAHACALEIIESSSNRLHPLFIHSASGLGKTHLLQAILHELRRRGDGRTAEYLSAEMFTNQFLYAMRTNRLDSFRHRYRNTDVLLIDDVHFMSNKTGLQEEFLHTYDAIDGARKQLVLASDVHPKMLKKIKQHLLNRFASGMIVRMTQPDFPTRVTILKGKLHQQNRRVPEEVLRYVARGFEGSVRELTGAVTMILAYASLTGAQIDVAMARQALSKLETGKAACSRVEAVEKAVGQVMGVKPEQMRGKRLTRSLRQARQVGMFLARKCTTLSCREIAQHFGVANHSSVVFAVNRVESQMKMNSKLAESVAAMVQLIGK